MGCRQCDCSVRACVRCAVCGVRCAVRGACRACGARLHFKHSRSEPTLPPVTFMKSQPMTSTAELGKPAPTQSRRMLVLGSWAGARRPLYHSLSSTRVLHGFVGKRRTESLGQGLRRRDVARHVVGDHRRLLHSIDRVQVLANALHDIQPARQARVLRHAPAWVRAARNISIRSPGILAPTGCPARLAVVVPGARPTTIYETCFHSTR